VRDELLGVRALRVREIVKDFHTCTLYRFGKLHA